MRELIFRGKAKHNGKWVISDSMIHLPIVGSVELYDEVSRDWVEVIPETVGQYTGLSDKHGANIFEGDIVAVMHSYTPDKSMGAFEVVFEGGCYFIKRRRDALYYSLSSDMCEIIGNKYDNGDLL